MANIVSDILKMNDLEIGNDKPLTTALLTKIGANINGLIDLAGNVQTVTSSGSWVVPEAVTRVMVLGCGGGGGGAGGNGLIGTSGDGGFGSQPILTTILVSPLQTLTITIGGGGAGGGGSLTPLGPFDGVAGGNTSVTGTGVDLLFKGADGGKSSNSTQVPSLMLPTVSMVAGGAGRPYNLGFFAGIPGERSLFALGGAGGAGAGASLGSGGGGGGAGFYPGGVGGAGGGTFANGSPGLSPIANSGGGGGGGGASPTDKGGPGGAGGSGIIIFIW